VPPGALGQGPEIEPGETLDAISGCFRIFQLEKGHRFSTDDVLVAWYGSTWCPSAQTILDLGSGIGTVGLIALWRLPGSRAVSVEAQVESVRLAEKSVRWNGVADRFDLRQGDFRDPQLFGPEERFDLILGSPPYFPPGSGVDPDHPQKIACRFEMKGSIADYCAVAARQLAAGGIFACVFPIAPPEQRERMDRAAAAAGLTIVRWRPIVLRAGERPLLGLFAAMNSADLPAEMRSRSWEEPPLIIRTENGDVHAEYAAVKLAFGFPP
jgi:tRNA1(Val) A37 N6-methylase TrmN6